MSILDDEGIRHQLRQAWEESHPGTADAREQGGFVLRGEDGSLSIERWGQGLQNQIEVPPHPAGKRGNRAIVATFHAHPNPGPDYQQEPSPTDIQAVRDDPDLGNPEFEGEYVIAAGAVYRIHRDGKVENLGATAELLKLPGGDPGA